jgi:hypothetical protein
VRRAFTGAFALDVDDGRPQQLDHGVVAGEVPAGLGDLAQLVVRGLDAVSGVRECPWMASFTIAVMIPAGSGER